MGGRGAIQGGERDRRQRDRPGRLPRAPRQLRRARAEPRVRGGGTESWGAAGVCWLMSRCRCSQVD